MRGETELCGRGLCQRFAPPMPPDDSYCMEAIQGQMGRCSYHHFLQYSAGTLSSSRLRPSRRPSSSRSTTRACTQTNKLWLARLRSVGGCRTGGGAVQMQPVASVISSCEFLRGWGGFWDRSICSLCLMIIGVCKALKCVEGNPQRDKTRPRTRLHHHLCSYRILYFTQSQP